MTESPPPSNGMLNVTAAVLVALLSLAILLNFIPGLWINPTLFQAGLFLTAALWSIRMLYRPYPIRKSFVLIPLAAAIAWPLLQLTLNTTVSRWETWYAALCWSANFTACFLAMQIAHSKRLRLKFLDALLIFALAITLISLLQFFSDSKKIFWFYDDAGREVFGPFKNRDRFAMFADFMIPIAIVRALSQKKLRQALFFCGIAATLFAAAMATGDRASAILILTEVIVLPLVAYYRGAFPIERLRGAVASFALLAVIFTVVVGYSFILNRFNDKDPYAARRVLLMGSIEMIKARPLYGFGMGNFENAYPAYEVFDFSLLVAHPHNDWAEWTAEGGIPFLVILLSVAIWVVPKALETLWGIGLVAIFAHSWVDFPLQNPALEFWVFTLIGVMAAEVKAAAKPKKLTGE